MSFSSSTKSWAACSKDKRRECKAHAVFCKLRPTIGEAGTFVIRTRRKLLDEVKALKGKQDRDAEITDENQKLIEMEPKIEKLTPDAAGLEQLERNAEVVIKSRVIEGVGPFSQNQTERFLRDGELSKIYKAAKKFSWSGSSSRLPNGKSESDVGVSDAVLDQLMSLSGADGLLSSWLQSSDERWKSSIDPEIKLREDKIKELKRKNSHSGEREILEREIEKLKADWRL